MVLIVVFVIIKSLLSFSQWNESPLNSDGPVKSVFNESMEKSEKNVE